MLIALTLPPRAGIVCGWNENSAKLWKTMLNPRRTEIFTDQEVRITKPIVRTFRIAWAVRLSICLTLSS